LSGVLLLLSAGCNKPEGTGELSFDTVWNLSLSKSVHPVDQVSTLRASLLELDYGRLMSDGTYSGYYKNDGWLYPCRVDDATGKAIDKSDGTTLLDWDDSNWFNKTDTSSTYALRGPDWTYYAVTMQYYLLLTSPAVRMQSYVPDGELDVAANRRWGVPLDRTKSIAVGNPTRNKPIDASYYDNEYIFTADSTLFDRRATITVKVVCGALRKVDIRAVYFNNVMSEALYMPMNEQLSLRYPSPFERWKKDGYTSYGDYNPASYNPLASYYLTNTYPYTVGAPAEATGDKFIVPDGDDPVHLVTRRAPEEEFVIDGEWTYLSDPDYEWLQGDNSKQVLTAIRDFPVFAMDYSALNGDTYRYKEIMPKVVVLSGAEGNIKTTVPIAANLEPMKHYTIYLFMSNVYVQAALTKKPWNDFSTDSDPINVTFGDNWWEIDASDIDISNWNAGPDIPIGDGTINN